MAHKTDDRRQKRTTELTCILALTPQGHLKIEGGGSFV